MMDLSGHRGYQTSAMQLLHLRTVWIMVFSLVGIGPMRHIHTNIHSHEDRI